MGSGCATCWAGDEDGGEKHARGSIETGRPSPQGCSRACTSTEPARANPWTGPVLMVQGGENGAPTPKPGRTRVHSSKRGKSRSRPTSQGLGQAGIQQGTGSCSSGVPLRPVPWGQGPGLGWRKPGKSRGSGRDRRAAFASWTQQTRTSGGSGASKVSTVRLEVKSTYRKFAGR